MESKDDEKAVASGAGKKAKAKQVFLVPFEEVVLRIGILITHQNH